MYLVVSAEAVSTAEGNIRRQNRRTACPVAWEVELTGVLEQGTYARVVQEPGRPRDLRAVGGTVEPSESEGDAGARGVGAPQ
jgi:hypothetical protein